MKATTKNRIELIYGFAITAIRQWGRHSKFHLYATYPDGRKLTAPVWKRMSVYTAIDQAIEQERRSVIYRNQHQGDCICTPWDNHFNQVGGSHD